MEKSIIDMFSGLGGASEAFHLAGWNVLRIDNNILLKDIPKTEISDITKIVLPSVLRSAVTVVWASPPCTEFSLACNAPRSIAMREGNDEWEPDMTLAKIAKEWIDHIKPRYWIVENVHGSQKYFEPLFGKPRQIIGSFVLYGNFPLIDIGPNFNHSKMEGDTWSTDPLRANKRAMVPMQISQGLLDAIQNQRCLEDYL